MSTITARTNRLITRNNAAVARAAGVALTADGMAVMQTRRPGLLVVSIALGALLILTLAKVAMLLVMGDAAYQAGLAIMQDGSIADRAAVWMMGVDGATSAIVSFFM